MTEDEVKEHILTAFLTKISLDARTKLSPITDCRELKEALWDNFVVYMETTGRGGWHDDLGVVRFSEMDVYHFERAFLGYYQPGANA